MGWLLGLGLAFAAILCLSLWARARWRRDVRHQVVDLLREEHPELEIVRESSPSIEIRFPDGTQGTLGLGNLYTGLAMGGSDPAAHREGIRTFVRGALTGLGEASQPLSLAAHGDRLMPRLADAAFVGEAARQGKPLVQRPTGVEGLAVVYVLDREDSVMYLGQERLAELALDAEALHQRALANLARRSIREMVRAVVERGQVAMVKLGDSYDAARLLLVPEALEQGEEVVAVIPDRETLGLLPPPGDGDWGATRKLARTPASPYRLLDRPLRVTRSGIAPA